MNTTTLTRVLTGDLPPGSRLSALAISRLSTFSRSNFRTVLSRRSNVVLLNVESRNALAVADSLAAAQKPMDADLKARLDEMTAEWRRDDALR